MNTNNLRRAPSLPVSLAKHNNYEFVEEAEDEDEDEPRMGDLIREAMPLPLPTPKLDRLSSLPSAKFANNEDVEKAGSFTRRLSVESPGLLQEKAPIARTMPKLSRAPSIDSSFFLPPKSNSKDTKQNPSNYKNKTPRKREPSKMNNLTKNDDSNILTLDTKIKPQKSLSALEIQELQGFKDLGFSMDNMDLSSNVTQMRPGRLERKASLDSSKVMSPYFSNRVDPKATSSQDMKAQIMFWARAVASNVR